MLERFVHVLDVEPPDHDLHDWMIRFRLVIDRFSPESPLRVEAGAEYPAPLRPATKGQISHVHSTMTSGSQRGLDRHLSSQPSSRTNPGQNALSVDTISTSFSRLPHLTVHSNPEGGMTSRLRHDDPRSRTTGSAHTVSESKRHDNTLGSPGPIEMRAGHGYRTTRRAVTRAVQEQQTDPAHMSGDTLIKPEYGVLQNPWLPNGLEEKTLSKLRYLMAIPPDGKTGYLYALEVTGQ